MITGLLSHLYCTDKQKMSSALTLCTSCFGANVPTSLGLFVVFGPPIVLPPGGLIPVELVEAASSPALNTLEQTSSTVLTVRQSGTHLVSIDVAAAASPGFPVDVGVQSNMVSFTPTLYMQTNVGTITQLLTVSIPLQLTSGQTISFVNSGSTPVTVTGGGMAVTFLHA
jgi:hypothetical protein